MDIQIKSGPNLGREQTDNWYSMMKLINTKASIYGLLTKLNIRSKAERINYERDP